MFTGIVEGLGKIRKVENFSKGKRLTIQAPFSLHKVKEGDSIAVDGCCLTVTRLQGKAFSADLSPETLQRSTLGSVKTGAPVNLERPLLLGDRLGGHLVQGHVDGVGEIMERRLARSKDQAYLFLKIRLPRQLIPFVIEKGSIAVDGISLTVNSVEKNGISLCLIPHTQAKTALTAKGVGARVNLEVDMMLKYIQNLLKPRYLKSIRKAKLKQKKSRK